MGIGRTLSDILVEKRINANELSQRINVSPSTIYSIIKRDNLKVDFEILIKICNELNVTIESFYSDYISTRRDSTIKLTPHQEKVIKAYIEQPQMQQAVDKLLSVVEEAEGDVSQSKCG